MYSRQQVACSKYQTMISLQRRAPDTHLRRGIRRYALIILVSDCFDSLVTRLAEKRMMLVILLLACALSITSFGPSLYADAVSEEESLFLLTNQERASRGIATLKRDALLLQVARNYSREMMEHQFFSHVSEVDGSTLWDRIRRSGYYDGYLGPIVIRENIALISGSANAEGVHQGFMNSQGHRENLLAADVNEMGVGITEGVFQSIFASIYVEVFAFHSRNQQEMIISASIDPNIVAVQRGETATFKIRVESNLQTTATIQVSNLPPALLWSIDKPSGTTPLDAVLTIRTSSAPPGTYSFNVLVAASGLTKILSSSITILQSTQTTSQITTSSTLATGTTASITTSSSQMQTSTTSTTHIATSTTSTTGTTTIITSTTLTTGATTAITTGSSQTGIATTPTTATQTTTKSSTGNASSSTVHTDLTTSTTTSVTSSAITQTVSGSTSYQTTQTTSTLSSSSSAITNQITETRTGITTIPLPPMRCIIATAAFGSELSPEIQFLRTFRDEIVMSTFGGRTFITVFNAAYYSFSPPIAGLIMNYPLVAHVVRVFLYPLIATLHLTVLVFDTAYFNTELAILFGGLFASSLIGAIYLSPLVILIGLLRSFYRKTLNT